MAKQKLPAPYPDPRADPKFRRLSVKRQEAILALFADCIAIDEAPVWRHCAQSISECHRQGGEIQRGYALKTLLNRHRQWSAVNYDWRALDKYSAIYKGDAPPLTTYNFDSKSVKAFLGRQGHTIKTWAASHGLNHAQVSHAISGTRHDDKTRRILDLLAAEMRAEPGILHAEIKKLRAGWQTLGERITTIEKHLRKK
jgi:hypothetical protein